MPNQNPFSTLKDPPSSTWALTSKLYNLPWTFLSEVQLTKNCQSSDLFLQYTVVTILIQKSNKQFCLLNRFFDGLLEADSQIPWNLKMFNGIPSKIISCTMNGTHSMCQQTFPLKTNNKKKVVLLAFCSLPLPVPFLPSLIFFSSPCPHYQGLFCP